EHADPAEARERDRHPRLGDRVHRGGDDRDLEHDRPRQAARGDDVVREDGGLGGDEQDVVEGQPFLHELVPRALQVAWILTAVRDVASGRDPQAWANSCTSTAGRRRRTSAGSKRPAPTSSTDAAPAAAARRSASSAGEPSSTAVSHCARSASPAPTTETGSSRGVTARYRRIWRSSRTS